MTDPNPPSELDEVVVTGQRRRNASDPFPPASGSGGYAEPPEGPVPIEVEEGEEPTLPPDPCSNPDTALEWNADAAAAEALRRMQQDANDPLLDGRERGFVLYFDPASQTVQLGNLAVGPNMGGSVTPDLTGIARENIIGFVHSHPASGPYPSGPDQTVLFPFFQNEITAAGGNASAFRLYMVGTRMDPGGQARLQIRVYNESNLNGDENNPGPEVNPDGEPCP